MNLITENTMKDSLHFLRQQEENVYIECYGIDFEDFDVDDIFEHRPGRTFTEEEVVRHATRSLDLTPHFVDHEYANKLQGKKRSVPEAFILSTMALSTKTFGKVVANLAMTNFIVEPVYAGDTLYYQSKILGKRESKSRPSQGIMHVETSAVNQHGKQVVSFQRQFLVYRRGQGPYQAAGY